MFPRFLRVHHWIIVPLVTMAVSQSANADDHAHHHGGGAPYTHCAAHGAASPATRAYEGAMHTMHQKMHVSLAGDPDVDFVRQMIPHHQGAVDMARIQLRYGRDASVKKLNAWIIQAQEREIGMMKTWLMRRDNGLSSQTARDYYGDAMRTMHAQMNIRYSGDADVDYVRGMIAHHQGAVDMASILMREGSDPELKELASDVFNSQTQEIAWMQGWLAEHGHR